MDDEVSVAELLVREGWGDDESPAARSRWRVVAVMLAVVIGCGTAAVLVAFSGTPRQDAQQVDQIRVIPMPDRTTGLGGADQSTDSPNEGGVGGGTGDSPGTHTATAHTAGHSATSSAAPTTAAQSSAPPTTGTSSRIDPTSVPSTPVSSPQQPAPTSPSPTTSHGCFLFICW